MTRLGLLALAIVFVSALATSPAVAADLDHYRASLEAIRANLSATDPDLPLALTELRGVEPITLSDGTTVVPDLSGVIAALDAEPADVVVAGAGLDAILAALDLAELGAASDAETSRAALERVLSREEFQPEPEADHSPSLWQRVTSLIGDVASAVAEWIDRVFGGRGDGGSPVSSGLAILGVLVVVGIVAFAVRGVRGAMSPSVARLVDGAEEAQYTSAQARAEAERRFAAGEYRAALRLLYLATLIRWEEAGRLRFDRTLTNREVVARVTLHGDASLLEQLSPLVERFDRVWYGGASCTSDDYRAFAVLAERAWEAA